MTARSRMTEITLGVIMLSCVIMPGSLHAAGGIYFDDVAVTNNSSVVMSDDFDDGDLDGWGSIHDSVVSSERSHSPSFSAHLNWHGGSVAHTYHSISIAQAGLVEASAWVWLPPVQEQYNWHHHTISFTNICLYSGNSNDNFFAGIRLHPGEAGYRVFLGWNESGGPGNTSWTNGVVLAPQTWAQLTLRLDSTSGLASARLDGQERLSFSYKPENFSSIDSTSLWGWLGDGVEPVPEPSSLLALGCGLLGLARMIRRREG